MLAVTKTKFLLRQAHKARKAVNHARNLSVATKDAERLSQIAADLRGIFMRSIGSETADALAPLYGRVSKASRTEPKVKDKLPLEAALECMRSLNKLVEATQVKAFLVSGTLLGCVREKRILAHDYDIDFGADIDDPGFDALVAALNAHPDFKLRKIQKVTNEIALHNEWARNYANKPWLAKYMYKESIPVDLFAHIFFRGEVFHGSKRNLWVNSDFDLRRTDLYGIEFNAPVEADRYLTENYGDWRTPVHGFQCTTDTPNSRVIHSLAAVKFLMKRYIVLGWHQDRKRQDIVMKRLRQCFPSQARVP